MLENLQGNYPQTESVCPQMPQDHPTDDQMAHEDQQQKCKGEMQPRLTSWLNWPTEDGAGWATS